MHNRIFISLCFFLITCCIVLIPGPAGAEMAGAKAVQVSIPEFLVTINGQVIDNDYSQYPMLVYNNVTYLPLTYDGCRFMGIKIAWYENKQVFFIGTDSIAESELKTYSTQTPNKKKYTATIPNYKTAVSTINSDEFLENREAAYPVLVFRGITYFPLTWYYAADKFDWNYTFNSQSGLRINSKDANRPILDNSKIGDTSPLRHLITQYAFSKDTYAGFPGCTMNGNYKFAYKKRGEFEKSFSMKEQLTGGDYYFNWRLDRNGYLNPDPDIKPSLDGNILSVVCVRYSGEYHNVKKENLLLKIDMETEVIISQETIPLTEVKTP